MSEAFALGLIGYPLDHSLSPRLHQAALAALGLPGSYCLYPVAPLPEGEAELAGLLARVRSGELHGLNVTIPHKQTVLSWLDELTPQAAGVGAVNTIYLRREKLTGDNTDAAGFLIDLARYLPARIPLEPETTGEPASALVLGAGGSARAVVYALAMNGWQITLAARKIEQAEALAARIQSILPAAPGIRCIPLGPGTPPPQPPVHLIVNTTPAGMFPDIHASPWVAGWPLPRQALVYDLVYNPGLTRLMQEARQAGLPAANGLGMLLEQAALAFERWTGRPAPREAMRAALVSEQYSSR